MLFDISHLTSECLSSLTLLGPKIYGNTFMVKDHICTTNAVWMIPMQIWDSRRGKEEGSRNRWRFIRSRDDVKRSNSFSWDGRRRLISFLSLCPIPPLQFARCLRLLCPLNSTFKDWLSLENYNGVLQKLSETESSTVKVILQLYLLPTHKARRKKLEDAYALFKPRALHLKVVWMCSFIFWTHSYQTVQHALQQLCNS